MMSDTRGPWIATLSGDPFYLDECNVSDIPLKSVVHALSMNCRYNGHISKHYSVAEHSVYVSLIVELMGGSRGDALAALFHDVSEAFIPDIPRPFKGYMRGFDEFEHRVLLAASEHYNFQYPLPEIVKYIDRHIVRAEATRLFPTAPSWVEDFDHLPIVNYVMDHGEIGQPFNVARETFVKRYEELRWT